MCYLFFFIYDDVMSIKQKEGAQVCRLRPFFLFPVSISSLNQVSMIGMRKEDRDKRQATAWCLP